MSLKTSKLRDAITLALAVGMLAGTSVALAQTTTPPAQSTTPATDDDPTTLDRIVVTGTRIRQAELETSQPVTVITRQDIEKQGFQSVADILQNISATGTPPISRASPLSAGELAGGTYISLRNLGAQRTLVLLNGKRIGITTSGFADISTIPAAAVERIEVLKDGASSIYGSDAIAGVINVITRSNFKGGSVSTYFGQYDQGDGDIKNGDFVIGFAEDKISVTIGGERRVEDAVTASSRDFSAFPRSSLHPTDNWTTVSQNGGFVSTFVQAFPNVVYPPATAANPNRSVRVVLRPGGDPRNRADYINQDQNVGSCANATPESGCAPGSTLHKSNTNQQTDLRTPVSSTSFFVDGILDINDNVRLRTNLLYSDRDSERTVAGYPMQAGAFSQTAPGLSSQSYFNPTNNFGTVPGTPINSWFRRTWEIPRVSDSNLKTYRISAALEGNFDWGDRYFDWDVGFLHNENKQRQSTYGNLNTPNTQRAVGPSFLNGQGRVQCGTAAAPIPFSECVPFNPFLPFGTEGQGGLTNNTELQNYLFQPELALGETKTQVFHANLSGLLFTLPAGDLGFAVGLERREEAGAFIPDPLSVAGVTTNLSAGPTRGGYNVNEAYVEFQIPILADVAFAKELTLNVASRYSDYDTFGETTNNSIGLKWRPIESLLLRGSANDGFRAPTISDLFGGGSQTFSFYTDPCDVRSNIGESTNGSGTRANCVGGPGGFGPTANTFNQLGQGGVPVSAQNAQTPVAFTQGSNPLLTPEISKSQTIGAVWSPSFVDGLNFALDWWKIRITDTIVTDTPTQILRDCYVQGIASRCSPSLFRRDPTTGAVVFASFGNRNAGYRKVEGFDFDVSYRFKTGIGDFNIVSNSTYTAKDYFLSTNDPRVPLSNVGVTSTFRIRSNLNVGWQWGDFGVNWITRYYSSMKEGCTYSVPDSRPGDPRGPGFFNTEALECNEITYAPNGAYVPGTNTPASFVSRRKRTGSVSFNDVQFRWTAPWNATVAVGANNVFEKYGPVMYTQPSANVSYYGGFDIGRFWYFKYTQRF